MLVCKEVFRKGDVALQRELIPNLVKETPRHRVSLGGQFIVFEGSESVLGRVQSLGSFLWAPLPFQLGQQEWQVSGLGRLQSRRLGVWLGVSPVGKTGKTVTLGMR